MNIAVAENRIADACKRERAAYRDLQAAGLLDIAERNDLYQRDYQAKLRLFDELEEAARCSPKDLKRIRAAIRRYDHL